MRRSGGAVVLRTDNAGHVVSRASVRRLQKDWVAPLRHTVKAYRTRVGPSLHSVYVRGSVAVGRAVPGASDIDTLAVVRDHVPLSIEWADDIARTVTRRWPYVAGVEVCLYPIGAVERTGRLAALIKTQCGCLYGTDLSARIRGFAPGIDLLFHAWDLPRDLAVARRALAPQNDAGAVGEICAWVMKRLVRSGFELVMAREGCYTRDLAACQRRFARHYPAEAPLMAEAVRLAVHGGNRGECLAVIDGLGEWLFDQICQEYGAARIAQLMAERARP